MRVIGVVGKRSRVVEVDDVHDGHGFGQREVGVVERRGRKRRGEHGGDGGFACDAAEVLGHQVVFGVGDDWGGRRRRLGQAAQLDVMRLHGCIVARENLHATGVFALSADPRERFALLIAIGRHAGQHHVAPRALTVRSIGTEQYEAAVFAGHFHREQTV